MTTQTRAARPVTLATAVDADLAAPAVRRRAPAAAAEFAPAPAPRKPRAAPVVEAVAPEPVALDHRAVMAAVTRALSDGRSAAFRTTPNVATIAVLVDQVARNLIELTGKRLSLAKVVAAIGTPVAAPTVKGADVALVPAAAPAAPPRRAAAAAAAPPAPVAPAAPTAKPAPAPFAAGDKAVFVDEAGGRFPCTVKRIKRDGVLVSWDDGEADSTVDLTDLRRRAGRPARAAVA